MLLIGPGNQFNQNSRILEMCKMKVLNVVNLLASEDSNLKIIHNKMFRTSKKLRRVWRFVY